MTKKQARNNKNKNPNPGAIISVINKPTPTIATSTLKNASGLKSNKANSTNIIIDPTTCKKVSGDTINNANSPIIASTAIICKTFATI